MTARLIIAGLLTLSAPLVGQDLFREPTQSTATRGDAALIAAIDQWKQVRGSDGLSFLTYADFLIAHPGWPGEAALRKAAERNLTADGAPPQRVIAYFTRFPAQAPAGNLRLAEAHDAVGQRSLAIIAAKRAWTGGALSNDDEARLLARYGTTLTTAEHDARMDRLLWQRATTAAARQLALCSPTMQPRFGLRLALLSRSPDAAARLAYAGPAATTDAGLIADRVAWLRATGQEPSARALLAAPRALAAPPLVAERWLETLLAVAKAAADEGDWRSAQAIARQADDTYPAGTEVRDQPLGERDDYTSLVWLGGVAAMDKLGRAGEAVLLFDRYAGAARSPQTRSKGLYWAGRAAEASGQRSLADSYYARAAVFFDQFYGQLATERLGQPLIVPATAFAPVAPAERAEFANREIVRAAQLLGSQGDWTTQSLFVRAIASAAATDADHRLAADFAMRINRPDLSVMIGRSAGINGYRDYVRAGFPMLGVPLEHQSDWTIIHAIARQESQFDRQIVSRSGARGLMQLMPGTAREQAGKIGIAYDASGLNDPSTNMRLGASYFGRLMDRYGGNYVLAVAAYNAGGGNVNKWLASNGDPRMPGVDVVRWIEAIPFGETRNYVQRVLENAVVYSLLAPQRGGQQRLSAYLGKAQPG